MTKEIPTWLQVPIVIILFGGWPVFIFLKFHSHQRALFIVFSLVLVSFFVSMLIADFGVCLHTPIPLYSWLLLPYLFAALLIVHRRRMKGNQSPAPASNEKQS